MKVLFTTGGGEQQERADKRGGGCSSGKDNYIFRSINYRTYNKDITVYIDK